MKSVPTWLLLCALTLGPGVLSAEPPARPPETTQISGREYVRLTDWARANEYEVRWLKRDETLQVGNRGLRLLLNIDSCEASINGVQVWLLAPVANRGGTIYVGHLDVKTTLRPILAPSRLVRQPRRIQTICLDPGHGGKDPGFCVGAKEEKIYTLLLAQELRQQLLRAGLKVTLTRTADSALELPDRPETARRRNADLFLSLHFNSAQPAVQGTEIYCLTPAGAESTNGQAGGDTSRCIGNQCNDKNVLLAFELQKSLTRRLEVEDRGVRRARFVVLRDAPMPAVLIEAGYMSHPGEGRKIFDPAYRKEIAHAIVEGLLAYKRLVDPTEELQAASR